MSPHLVDTHSHLHFPDYDADRGAVLERMREKDVWTITIGTTIGTSAGAAAFADATEGVWAAAGYHPEHFTSDFTYAGEEDKGTYSIGAIRDIAAGSKKIVAIGETGLDFYRMEDVADPEEGKRTQERAFREHLALAAELDLPVIIHCRDALDRLAEVLQDERSSGRRIRGVVHCFTGTWKEAKPLLDLGVFLSFTGIVTFPPKKNGDPERHVHRVIERMPADRILLETDAPFLAPVPHRGERNEPVFVEFVGQTVARLRGMEYEDVARETTENAVGLFRLPA